MWARQRGFVGVGVGVGSEGDTDPATGQARHDRHPILPPINQVHSQQPQDVYHQSWISGRGT